MTLKDIAQKLTTSIQTIPELVRILAEGLENAEAGSQIEVTAIQESGTKIATITIDEEATDIYAPTSEVIYSTAERKIGKWIDNSDLYEKTIDIGAIEATLSKDVAHGISIGTLVSAQGSAYNSSTSMWFPIPYVDNDASYQRYCYVTDTNVRVGGAANAAAVSSCYVTIRYTKPQT